MNKHADAIVVGGGIIGLAIAYFLSKEGVTVRLIDRHDIGQASIAGAGILGAQVEMNEPGPLFDAGMQSRSMYPALRDELLELTQVDIELQQAGVIRVATSEEDLVHVIQKHKWQESLRARSFLLSPTELAEQTKDQVPQSYGGLYIPDDYQVRNAQLLTALRKACQLRGVILEDQSVQALHLCQQKVCGVMTNNEIREALIVIVAGGAWTGAFLSQHGVHLPVSPVKGQSFFVKATPNQSEHTLFTEGMYMVPKYNGEVYIGATMEHVGFDAATNDLSEKLIQSARMLVPSIKNSPILRKVVGFRPATSDELPVIGPIQQIEGLYTASGHFRNGVLLTPITAQILSNMIINSDYHHPYSAFDPNRF